VADHRTAKSLLEKVKRDFENEHKRNLDLGVELKERQSKIEAT
jgi:ribosomal protein S17E